MLNKRRWMMMALPLIISHFSFSPVQAQLLLSLDSCRAMALRNNKQLGVSKLKQEVARNVRKSVRTKYLPHVSALGTYQYTSEPVSLLSDDQKTAFSSLGTTLAGNLSGSLTNMMNNFGQQIATLNSATLDAIYQQMAAGVQTQMGQVGGQVAQALNAEGQKIVDAFDTDTRHFFAGTVMVTQPVFMGGAIVAMNKLADQNEQMQENSAEARQQSVIYNIDKAYWQVVSLRQKQRLAESFVELVRKLDSDVQKMIAEGVATRSEGLSVSVKLNEAEMSLLQVNDGLTLSKMLLCQLIGLPSDSEVTLADETTEDLNVALVQPDIDMDQALVHRPELRMLDNSVEMAHQVTNIMKAGHMPQVALMGGYAVSNPSLQNGFERKFRGFWNVGVLMRIPIWNWGDVTYKVRAAKSATAIASLELEEAREKIGLQVNQVNFKVKEATKRLQLAESGIQRAEENLRTANLGFQEGVISPTVVMEAQTAWLQAQSQKIDAQISVLLSIVDMRKAQGTLRVEN